MSSPLGSHRTPQPQQQVLMSHRPHGGRQAGRPQVTQCVPGNPSEQTGFLSADTPWQATKGPRQRRSHALWLVDVSLQADGKDIVRCHSDPPPPHSAKGSGQKSLSRGKQERQCKRQHYGRRAEGKDSRLCRLEDELLSGKVLRDLLENTRIYHGGGSCSMYCDFIDLYGALQEDFTMQPKAGSPGFRSSLPSVSKPLLLHGPLLSLMAQHTTVILPHWRGPVFPFSAYLTPSATMLPLHLSSQLTGKHPLEPTPNRMGPWITEGGMPKACPDMKQAFYSLNLLSHLES